MIRKPATRRTIDEWSSLIKEQLNSKLTVQQFCQKHKLTQSNFYLWRKRLTEEGADPSREIDEPAASPWVQLSSPPASPQTAWHIELDLPNGVTLRMRSA